MSGQIWDSKMADYLTRKPGESIWYARMAVPDGVRHAFGGRAKLIKTTGTSNRAEAKGIAMLIAGQWKAEIKAAREAKAGNADEWRLAQHTVGLDLQEKRTQGISSLFTPALTKSSPLSQESEPADIEGLFLALLRAAEDLHDQGQHEILARLTRYARKYGDILENGATAGAGADLHSELLSILADMEATAIAGEYNLSKTEHQEAQEIVHNPTIYKPRSPITPSMIEAWENHLTSQIASEKTRDTHRARLEKISKYLTTEGAPLTFETIHKFLGNQSGARQTLQNYLWSGRSFWKWAIKYNSQFREQFSGSPCPFDDHELPKTGKAAGESYTAFTCKEVEDLYSVASQSGKDALSHLIVFGAYTGARLEEIGRIRPEHTIYDKAGEPIGFKITQAKTEAGVREVPIHPALAPLYKHLCSLADANDGYLFKGGKNQYDNRLDWLSKQFGNLKKKANFSGLHVFHSIRKTVTSELHKAGVGLEVLPYIVGHENKSFTLSVYSSGCSFEQKTEAIKHLRYNFN